MNNINALKIRKAISLLKKWLKDDIDCGDGGFTEDVIVEAAALLEDAMSHQERVTQCLTCNRVYDEATTSLLSRCPSCGYSPPSGADWFKIINLSPPF